MKINKLCQDIIARMDLELKLKIYSHLLSKKDPNKGEVEMGFALVCDSQVQAHISEKLGSKE